VQLEAKTEFTEDLLVTPVALTCCFLMLGCLIKSLFPLVMGLFKSFGED
jgi:hypothetical protein